MVRNSCHPATPPSPTPGRPRVPGDGGNVGVWGALEGPLCSAPRPSVSPPVGAGLSAVKCWETLHGSRVKRGRGVRNHMIPVLTAGPGELPGVQGSFLHPVQGARTPRKTPTSVELPLAEVGGSLGCFLPPLQTNPVLRGQFSKFLAEHFPHLGAAPCKYIEFWPHCEGLGQRGRWACLTPIMYVESDPESEWDVVGGSRACGVH